MALEDQDKQDIAKMITDAMASHLKPPEPAEPEPAPAPATEQPDLVKQLGAMVKGLMDESTTAQANATAEALYNDKFNTSLVMNDGFKEFLDSTDDYNKVRLEGLNAIPVTERLDALTALEGRYQQANASTPGETQQMTPKQQKHFEDTESKYQSVTDKFLNPTPENKFQSIDEFTEAWFDEVANEANALIG